MVKEGRPLKVSSCNLEFSPSKVISLSSLNCPSDFNGFLKAYQRKNPIKIQPPQEGVGKGDSMKNSTNKLIGIMLFSFSFLFACATAPETQQETKIPIVDAGYFTVEPPYGVWSCQVNKQMGFISFGKSKYSVLGAPVGSTLIRVFRNGVKEELWQLSEEEVADDFRKQEENTMVEEGVKKGQYKLEDVKKDITTIGGKKLYFMSYKTSTPFKVIGGGTKINAVLYLHFPPEFKENHIFYGFLFSESHATGALVTFDVELVHSVINSLKIKTD